MSNRGGGPFNTPAFRRLKAEWDARLANSGFVDIERQDEERFKRLRALARDPVENSARELYYSRASEFLHTNDWPAAIDRVIWSLHTEGLAVRKIAVEVERHPRYVQYRVEKYRRMMLEER